MSKTQSQTKGLMGWFIRNPVAANLLMICLLVGGLLTLRQTEVEVFPTVDPHVVTVSVPYPGATPEEVEESVCQRVEEAVRGLDGVKRVRSVSSEGGGSVTIEAYAHADDQELLEDVQRAVDQLSNFPPGFAEKVVIEDTQYVRPVLTIALVGEGRDSLALRQEAVAFQNALLADPGISLVSLAGVSNPEIRIDISPEALREYGLSFSEVAARLRSQSINLGAGTMRTDGGSLLLRVDGRARRADEFLSIPIVSREDGAQVLLSDIASAYHTLEDNLMSSVFDDKPAVYLQIDRGEGQNVLDVERQVRAVMGSYAFPEGVEAVVWRNRVNILKSRVNLLVRNGLMGLALVFGILVLFMNMRLAFWTTMGIPISFLGAFLLLPLFGVTVNMISLFALIIVLGIVVDDAIVVGEHIHSTRRREGKTLVATLKGVREVAAPVVLGISTTVAAFSPLLFMGGHWGQLMWQVPAVVIAVLAMSLIEALYILPCHLTHESDNASRGPLAWIQKRMGRGLSWVVRRPYAFVLGLSIRYRYVFVAGMIAILMLTYGMVKGGYVKQVYMPPVERNSVSARIQMAPGTPIEETQRALDQVLAGLQKARSQVEAQMDGAPFVSHVASTLGGHTGKSRGSSSHRGEVRVQLASGETSHRISAGKFGSEWRKATGEIPGVREFSLESRIFSFGEDVDLELSHPDKQLLDDAVERVADALKNTDGVFNIQRSDQDRQRELHFVLTAEGRAAGLSLSQLAQQVRGAVYGAEVDRVQIGRDEVKVMVRASDVRRFSQSILQDLWVRLPSGEMMPLTHVATLQEASGPSKIVRVNGGRVVSLTAQVDKAVGVSPEIVLEKLRIEGGPIEQLTASMPGLRIQFEGEEQQRKESNQGMRNAMMVALLLIFVMVAIQLRSYVQGIMIMLVIPFGVIGAVFGHWVTGHPLSFMSLYGIVALTGVVVNDGLVLMDMVNRLRKKGVSEVGAAYVSGQRRFRAVLFTSLTTFFGLLPMLLEKSVQAQFLIPMALSLAFGIAFATVITLLLLPCLEAMRQDARVISARLRTGN